jgi:hypothetical protein
MSLFTREPSNASANRGASSLPRRNENPSLYRALWNWQSSRCGIRAVTALVTFSCAIASAEPARELHVDAIDLPYRAGLGYSGFAILPGSTPDSEHLFEFGIAEAFRGFSQITDLRDDGLIRKHELFLEGGMDLVQVARSPEPLVLMLTEQRPGFPSGHAFQVRYGTGLTQARSFSPEHTFGLVKDLALVDPTDPYDFHYSVVESDAVHLMHSKSGEPIWSKPLQWGHRVISFQPDPDGPTRLAVGTASQVLILDPLTGETVSELPISGEAGLASAKLSPDGGEQILVADHISANLLAIDTLTGETLWQVESTSYTALHAHDLSGNGRDEILIGKWTDHGPIIEWRSADGALIHQTSKLPLFRNAAIFDISGDGTPKIILDFAAGIGGNQIVSLDLQTSYPLPSIGTPSVSDRFQPVLGADQTLSLIVLTKFYGQDEQSSFRSAIRSVSGSNGELNWINQFETSDFTALIDITGFAPAQDETHSNRLYVLSVFSENFQGTRIYELDSDTGAVLQSNVIDIDGENAFRLLAIDSGGNSRLVLFTELEDEVRYHFLNPQSLELFWSSEALELQGMNFQIEAIEGQHLLISGFGPQTGGRALVVDLDTQTLVHVTDPDLVSAHLYRDRSDRLVLAAQNVQHLFYLRDLESGHVFEQFQLDFPVASMFSTDFSLLLTGSNRVHLLDLHSGNIVCRSRILAAGAFKSDPGQSHRVFMANRTGIYAIPLAGEPGFFRDRFEPNETSFCNLP